MKQKSWTKKDLLPVEKPAETKPELKTETKKTNRKKVKNVV